MLAIYAIAIIRIRNMKIFICLNAFAPPAS